MPHRDGPLTDPVPLHAGRDRAGLLLLFFVAIDALSTLLMLRQQHGFELNPVATWLLGHGEAAFLLVKMLLTAVAVAWLIRRADRARFRLVLLVGFAIYVPIVGLHIFNNLYVEHALLG